MLSLQSPKCFWSRYRRISLAVFISTFLLSIPLIAMQFTTEVNWGIGDFAVFGFMVLTACASSKPFVPKSDYPPDPWVKSYSEPDDCLGGEKLAARNVELPEHPRKAWRAGAQGWVLLRLDVDAAGETQNVEIERAVPDRYFGGGARKAAQDWQFQPPQDGPLRKCRVLIRYQLGGVSLGG